MKLLVLITFSLICSCVQKLLKSARPSRRFATRHAPPKLDHKRLVYATAVYATAVYATRCFLILGLSIMLISCDGPKESKPENIDKDETETTMNGELTFLALGDSYTIGERVAVDKRWPIQLANKLNDTLEQKLKEPRIIARTGWTTDELQKAINETEITPPYDLVSLLIGVNNQYRCYPLDQFINEFETLLKQAIAFAGNDTSNVFVVSIPDYGVTPFVEGKGMDKQKIAEEINLYNSKAKDLADRYNVKYFNITPISRKAENQVDLIAEDGLHPSGEMYSEWVELMVPWAIQILDE